MKNCGITLLRGINKTSGRQSLFSHFIISGTHVDVKGCVKVLREQEKARAEGLLNALRYTTKHLNEETTPKSTKSLLFEDMT